MVRMKGMVEESIIVTPMEKRISANTSRHAARSVRHASVIYIFTLITNVGTTYDRTPWISFCPFCPRASNVPET